jgi:ketosteroid isomerase-like protein
MTQTNAATQSNAELLRKGYEAFATGDVPGVLAILSEDITFHIPGRNPTSGDYTGYEEVTGFFQTLAERSNGTFSIDVHDLLDNGEDTVVVLVTHNGQRDAGELAIPGVHVWRFADGKAMSHQSYIVDDHENDAFWS